MNKTSLRSQTISETSLTGRFCSVNEFHAELGSISKAMVYKMIAEGEIPARKIGRRIVIPATWAQSYINQPCILKNKVHGRTEDA